MTREEAIAIIENEKKCVNRANKNYYCNRDCYNCELVKTDTEILEALDMAIKALEQTEPEKCGDCISREALQEWIKDKTFGDIVVASEHNFDCLPSVEPERKTGKWEYVQYDGNPKIGNWHCSECRLIVNFGFEGAPYYHYCPGCGAKMEVDG